MKNTKLDLFLTFFRIGVFTFGGGYAMTALLRNEFVTKKKYIDDDEFLDIVAIAESTPGPIAINCATYIGYKFAGLLGAIVSTVGVCIPSFFIIYIISLFFDAFLSLSVVKLAFDGIRACVIYLIITTGISMFKNLKKSPFNYLIVLTVFASMVICSFMSLTVSSIMYIVICCIIGIFLGKDS